MAGRPPGRPVGCSTWNTGLAGSLSSHPKRSVRVVGKAPSSARVGRVSPRRANEEALGAIVRGGAGEWRAEDVRPLEPTRLPAFGLAEGLHAAGPWGRVPGRRHSPGVMAPGRPLGRPVECSTWNTGLVGSLSSHPKRSVRVVGKAPVLGPCGARSPQAGGPRTRRGRSSAGVRVCGGPRTCGPSSQPVSLLSGWRRGCTPQARGDGSPGGVTRRG
jgi:hypothetical protein